MSYRELFDRVAYHLRGMGIEVEVDSGPPLKDSALKRARKKSYVSLPQDLIDFHQEMGDGFSFYWNKGDEDGDPFSNIELGSLGEIVADNLELMDYSCEWDADYEFSGTDDPELAKRTAARMRSWTHFHSEGNGDTFALDGSGSTCPVVFNFMAWMDGGTGENGPVIGASLRDFFEQWSRVCFQFPDWYRVIDRDAGVVHWDSDLFIADFRLP